MDNIPKELTLHPELGNDIPSKLTPNKLFPFTMLVDSQAVQSVPVYTRDVLLKLHRALNNFIKTSSEKRIFRLEGSPGSGKTSYVTLYCRGSASVTGRRVLFISYRAQEQCDIQVFLGDKVYWVEGGILALDLAATVRRMFTENNGIPQFHLCVLDGVRNPDKDVFCGQIFSVVNAFTGKNKKFKQSIFITSMGFRFRDRHSLEEYEDFPLDSWTWESHKLCLKAMLEAEQLPELLKEDVSQYILTRQGIDDASDADNKAEEMDVDDEEVFEPLVEGALPESEGGTGNTEITEDWLLEYAEDKFFYAGGCARYMYSRKVSALKGELSEYMKSVEDWKPFTTNDLPSGSSPAVNALMQQFTSVERSVFSAETETRTRTTAVSKFVLLAAYDKCHEELLYAVESIAQATENPSLGGWSFELQELSKIKKVLKNPDGHSRHIKTSKNLVLCPRMEATYDGNTLVLPYDLSDGLLVIWCLKWNQGCFDAAAFWQGTLVTLQFTTMASDSLKLEYVSQLRFALLQQNVDVKNVVHCFILKDMSHDTFAYKSPTGTGRSSCKVEYKVSICKSTRFELIDGEGSNNLSIDGVEVSMDGNKHPMPGGVASTS